VNDPSASTLQAILARSPLLAPILLSWDRVALPDGWLAAGAVAQTVWNHRFALPPIHGIDDIDIVYFDADDLSKETEETHAARLRHMFAALPVRLDVKNQARVHLWYAAKFGYAIAPYASIADAIATFPTTATAVGLRPRGAGLELCAPYGIADLLGAVVRPNRKQITPAIYAAKVARWIALWPRLTVMPWDD
jgi:hypothetical protein